MQPRSAKAIFALLLFTQCTGNEPSLSQGGPSGGATEGIAGSTAGRFAGNGGEGTGGDASGSSGGGDSNGSGGIVDQGCPNHPFNGFENTCAYCVGLACGQEGRVCQSDWHQNGPVTTDCSCVAGHVACCTTSGVGPGAVTSCAFGGFPQPACPTALPLNRASCSGINSCEYGDPSCGQTNAYCDGSIWHVVVESSPVHGAACSPAPLHCTYGLPYGGARRCDCDSPQGEPIWQCLDHAGGLCPSEAPDAGSTCTVGAGLRCDYSFVDGGLAACTCDKVDGGQKSWSCVVTQ